MLNLFVFVSSFHSLPPSLCRHVQVRTSRSTSVSRKNQCTICCDRVANVRIKPCNHEVRYTQLTFTWKVSNFFLFDVDHLLAMCKPSGSPVSFLSQWFYSLWRHQELKPLSVFVSSFFTVFHGGSVLATQSSLPANRHLYIASLLPFLTVAATHGL